MRRDLGWRIGGTAWRPSRERGAAAVALAEGLRRAEGGAAGADSLDALVSQLAAPRTVPTTVVVPGAFKKSIAKSGARASSSQ